MHIPYETHPASDMAGMYIVHLDLEYEDLSMVDMDPLWISIIMGEWPGLVTCS